MIEFSNISDQEPYQKLHSLYQSALSKGQQVIEAMCISSYSKDEKEVDARFVNLNCVEQDKLIFYTNYISPKSIQFRSHNQIALTLYWTSINVQIRIKGRVSVLDKSTSDNHFEKRDYRKNALAIASKQSKEIDTYEDFMDIYHNILANNDLKKRPDYWGGYSVLPYYFEFWEGHESRINKRIAYNLNGKDWKSSFLQP